MDGFGACDGIRTCDLRITNALHYRLCYTSILISDYFNIIPQKNVLVKNF